MFLALLFSVLTLLPNTNTGTLVLQIENIANHKGSLRIALFQGEANFLKEGKELFPTAVEPISGSSLTIKIPDVPFGTYALAIYHDENGNNELDKNFMGIPREAYSFSNNPKIKWRGPTYAETKFDLSSTEKPLNLSLRKWSKQ